jgi:hypothetical protein
MSDLSLGSWPEEIPGLGTKSGGKPFARCVEFPPKAHPFASGTHVQYGGVPFCKKHANDRCRIANGGGVN